MSGPKSHHTPPPMFSQAVLEGRLHQVLRAITDLRAAREALSSVVVRDRHRRVHGEGASVVASTREAFAAATEPVSLDLPPRFGSSERATAEAALDRRIKRARELLDRYNRERAVLEAWQRDWDAWDHADVYATRTDAGLRAYATAAAAQLRGVIDEVTAAAREVGAAELEAVKLDATLPPCEKGFAGRADAARQAIDAAAERGQTRVIQLCNQTSAAAARAAARAMPRADPEAEAKARLEGQVRQAIATVGNEHTREALSAELRRLLDSQVQRDLRFLTDLAERARERAATEVAKAELGARLASLSAAPPRSVEAHDAWRAAIDAGAKAMTATQVDPRLAHEFEAQARRAAAIEEAARQRAELVAAERAFVRAEVVRGLQKRGYVAEAASVAIDFNAPGDVVLAAPGGKGLVSVSYSDEGLRYAYFVAEKPGGPTAEAQARATQVRSCELYNEVLGDLQRLGVPIQANFAVPPQEAPLHVAPEKFKKRLRPAEKHKTAASRSQQAARELNDD
jgi:hypothetical protein